MDVGKNMMAAKMQFSLDRKYVQCQWQWTLNEVVMYTRIAMMLVLQAVDMLNGFEKFCMVFKLFTSVNFGAPWFDIGGVCSPFPPFACQTTVYTILTLTQEINRHVGFSGIMQANIQNFSFTTMFLISCQHKNKKMWPAMHHIHCLL